MSWQRFYLPASTGLILHLARRMVCIVYGSNTTQWFIEEGFGGGGNGSYPQSHEQLSKVVIVSYKTGDGQNKAIARHGDSLCPNGKR